MVVLVVPFFFLFFFNNLADHDRKSSASYFLVSDRRGVFYVVTEPADRHALGRCDPNTPASSCLDENAQCLNHKCHCMEGFIADPLDYSCSESNV